MNIFSNEQIRILCTCIRIAPKNDDIKVKVKTSKHEIEDLTDKAITFGPKKRVLCLDLRRVLTEAATITENVNGALFLNSL